MNRLLRNMLNDAHTSVMLEIAAEPVKAFTIHGLECDDGAPLPPQEFVSKRDYDALDKCIESWKREEADWLARVKELEAALRDQDLQWIGVQACPDNKCESCVKIADMQRRKIASALETEGKE